MMPLAPGIDCFGVKVVQTAVVVHSNRMFEKLYKDWTILFLLHLSAYQASGFQQK